MDPQERARIIASLTDDELKDLRDRATDPPAPEDPTQQFLREVHAERDRDWLSEVLERINASSQPVIRRGNHVPSEGGSPGRRAPVSAGDYNRDFFRQLTDPTYGGNDMPLPETH